MNMDNRITGTARTTEISAPGPGTTIEDSSGMSLLPEPGKTVTPAMLATLVLEATKASREAYHAAARAASQDRAAAGAEEVEKMHDQADNALVGGFVSGGLQAASGAMSLTGALDTNEGKMFADQGMTASSKALADSGARWSAGAQFANASATFAQSMSQANGMDLQADAKQAQNDADAAKDRRDEAMDGLRAQQDLEKSFLQAYSALLGSESQVWQATMVNRA